MTPVVNGTQLFKRPGTQRTHQTAENVQPKIHIGRHARQQVTLRAFHAKRQQQDQQRDQPDRLFGMAGTQSGQGT